MNCKLLYASRQVVFYLNSVERSLTGIPSRARCDDGLQKNSDLILRDVSFKVYVTFISHPPVNFVTVLYREFTSLKDLIQNKNTTLKKIFHT